MYSRNADAIIIVFDLTNIQSFNKVKQHWIKRYNNDRGKNDSCTCCLIGNKLDLHESITTRKDDVYNFINTIDPKIRYYETSAKTGENIVGCFEDLGRILSKKNIVIDDWNSLSEERIILAEEHDYVNKKDSCC
jgi:GTPase SAR1 family protein